DDNGFTMRAIMMIVLLVVLHRRRGETRRNAQRQPGADHGAGKAGRASENPAEMLQCQNRVSRRPDKLRRGGCARKRVLDSAARFPQDTRLTDRGDGPMTDVLFQSDLKSVELIHRGKVRDVYRIDAERLLVVASDRLSAFDVILPDPIPGKGRILTQISNFWFDRTRDIIPNHLLDTPLSEVLTEDEAALVEGRAVVVRALRALPVEAVARGYLIGSGWKEYQATGSVCGIRLPAGLRIADRLPEPIFTPATKADVG